MTDIFGAKTVSQCIEIATLDASSDEEVAMSWENCLDEVFTGTHALLAGQKVKVKGFDAQSGLVLACCRFQKRKIRVTLDSLNFLELTDSQRLWLRACLKWQNQGWAYYA